MTINSTGSKISVSSFETEQTTNSNNNFKGNPVNGGSPKVDNSGLSNSMRATQNSASAKEGPTSILKKEGADNTSPKKSLEFAVNLENILIFEDTFEDVNARKSVPRNKERFEIRHNETTERNTKLNESRQSIADPEESFDLSEDSDESLDGLDFIPSFEGFGTIITDLDD